jgi:MFS family permease
MEINIRLVKPTPTQHSLPFLISRAGLSILFVSYIIAQVPSNLLLNHLGRPSLYLGFFVCAWGLVSALTCLVKSYAGIIVCRLMLGFMEAPFFPGTAALALW